MITVQMTLDEKLVKQVDALAHKLKTSRSALTRQALLQTIKHYQDLALEKKHRAGYLAKPVLAGEFDVFETEQEWGDK